MPFPEYFIRKFVTYKDITRCIYVQHIIDYPKVNVICYRGIGQYDDKNVSQMKFK